MSLSGYLLFRSQLAQANPPELYPIEWLDDQVLHGLAHPIIGRESAMVVGIRTYPGGMRVGHIIAAAGDIDELITELGPRAEEWGRERDCKLAMIEGRPGWVRALKEHGWRAHQAVLTKEL